MSGELDIDEDPAPEPPPKAKQKSAAAKPGTNGTHAPADAEMYLLSCCLVEPDRLAEMAHIPVTAYSNPEAAPIWQALRDRVDPLDYEVFPKRAKVSVSRLLELRRLAGVRTGWSGWLREFDEGWRRVEFQKIAVDMSKAENTDPGAWIRRLEGLSAQTTRVKARDLFTFGVPDPGDPSVLLGDRYLNRGDGMVLSCTSGMGKSSMARQMMARWARGLDFHGIKPNGKLRSLEIQAEDSDGDIGEVAVSIAHIDKLTEADIAELKGCVVLVTERVRRGMDFIDEMRRLVRLHKPDLVWINPLQSFIEGDITEAHDLSAFLHGGLNVVNADSAFAYVIVHHTTKPPKGDAKKMGMAWNEIMYDMAGGALLINWARAIISLRAAPEKGDFNLILAKRGTRAGVTREVAQGAGVREELVTEIPLRWSRELIEVPGRKRRLGCIFWEPREPGPDEGKKKAGVGRPRMHNFATYKNAFPTNPAEARGINEIVRRCKEWGAITKPSLYDLIDEAVADGLLFRIVIAGVPKYYRKAEPV